MHYKPFSGFCQRLDFHGEIEKFEKSRYDQMPQNSPHEQDNFGRMPAKLL